MLQPEKHSITAPAASSSDVLARAFTEYLNKRYGAVAMRSSASASVAAGAWALDSGTSQFVVGADNVEDQLWDTVQHHETEVLGCAGLTQCDAAMGVEAPRIGRRNAVQACLRRACGL